VIHPFTRHVLKKRKFLPRLLPLLVIAGLALAFAAAGGNDTSCGGACFLPEAPVVVSRH